MKSKLFVLQLAIGLLLINLFSVYFLDLFDSRIVRVVSIGLFFIYYLSQKVKDRLIFVVVFLLLIADILDLYYSQALFAKIYAIVKISAYAILIKRLTKKLNFSKFKNGFGVLFGIIIFLNLLIGYRTVYNVSAHIEDDLEIALLLVYGFTVVMIAVFSANYYVRYNTKRAYYFIGFIYLLLFADLSGFIANYLALDGFFYIERIFYFTSLIYLSFYLFFTTEKDDKAIIFEE